MKLSLNIDTKAFKRKPRGAETGGVSNRTRRAEAIRTIDSEELAQIIEQGYTFTPAELDGPRAENWKSQQLICIDIDNEFFLKDEEGRFVYCNTNRRQENIKLCVDHPTAPDYAARILRKHNIEPFIIYKTFSYTEGWPRFRVVILLDQKLDEVKKAVDYTERLAHIVPHADGAIKTPERLLFAGPTNCIIYCNTEAVTSTTALDKLPIVQKHIVGHEAVKPPVNAAQLNIKGKQSKTTFNSLEEYEESVKQAIKQFDIASFITSSTSAHIKRVGGTTYATPCPVCGRASNNCCIRGHRWTCYDTHNTTGIETGTIIDLLRAIKGYSTEEALKCFEFEILGYSETEKKKLYAQKKDREETEEFSRKLKEYKEKNTQKPTDQSTEATAPAPQLDYTENGRLIKSIKNAGLIMELDEKLKNIFAYNILTKTLWIRGRPGQALAWREQEGNYRPLDNLDKDFLYAYMEQYGFNNASKIDIALTTTASKQSFNPIADLLNSLKWDGKPRIKTLLADYLGADRTAYTAEIMKIVMLGAVNRALRPGCKFDYVLILAGPQGSHKTTFCNRLALDDSFFNNSIALLDGEKTARQIRGKWIIELGELLAVKRSKDVEAVKSFITQTTDNFVPKFKELAEDFPRSCIFIGTTNASSFLSDPTGARRFLPVEVAKHPRTKSVFDEGASEDIRQAWAEAVHIYRTGNYLLTAPQWLEEELKETRATHEEEDPQADTINTFLLDHKEVNSVCSKFLFYDVLGNSPDHPEKFDRKETRHLNEIMQAMEGWQRSETKQRFNVKYMFLAKNGTTATIKRDYGIVYVYKRLEEVQPESDFMTIEEDEDTPF